MSSLGKLFLSPGAKSACSYRDRSWDFEKGKTPNSKCLLNLFLLDFLYLHFYLYSRQKDKKTKRQKDKDA